jgi:hypothetical protein
MEGEADMVIGYPKRGESTVLPNPTIPLSGERALYRHDILPILPAIRNSKFGVETIINFYYRKQGKKVKYVPLEGLIHLLKVEKTGFTSAVGMYTREASEIATAVARNYPLALAALGLDPRPHILFLKKVPMSVWAQWRRIAGEPEPANRMERR